MSRTLTLVVLFLLSASEGAKKAGGKKAGGVEDLLREVGVDHVSEEEFEKSNPQQRPAGSQRQDSMGELFGMLDTDKDGKVELSEASGMLDGLVMIMSMQQEPGQKEQPLVKAIKKIKKLLPGIFALVDKNDDGSVQKAELEKIMGVFGALDGEALKIDSDSLFEEADADKDEQISVEEATNAFPQITSKLPTALKDLIEDVKAEKQVQAFFALVDSNKDKSVTKKEVKRVQADFKMVAPQLQQLVMMGQMMGGFM